MVPPTGKIVPKWSDGCIQAEVEGLTPKERRTTRSKLEAAVGGSSVDLHDMYMYMKTTRTMKKFDLILKL